MSTSVMSACWALDLPLVAKAVLISLADNANDDGYCWPSIDTICSRVCASRRAVIDAIKDLEAYKVLVADRTNGRHTTYQITPSAWAKPVDKRHAPVDKQCATRTSAPNAPVHDAPKPVRQMHGGGAPDARGGCAKRTLTVIEPSMNRQEPKEGRPDGVSDQVWSDFKAMRAKQKAPITLTAIDGIRREAEKAGITLDDALRECCERSWRGFRAAWLQNARASPTANKQEALEARNRAASDEWLKQSTASGGA